MANKELDQQDKQEQKEERQEEMKKTLKTIITSVICTLLFVVILLLSVILCLKNCSPRNNNNAYSSSSVSEPTWIEYDNPKLDNIFKKMINNQIVDLGFNDDIVSSVIAVTCNDSNSAFTLNIAAYSETKVYYYNISNYAYTGFNSFVKYLLDYNFDTEFVLDGNVTLNYLEIDSNQNINTSKAKEKHIIAKSASDRYISGYYIDEDNKYHVYNKQVYTDGNDPYLNSGELISYDSDLYGYYRYLNA